MLDLNLLGKATGTDQPPGTPVYPFDPPPLPFAEDALEPWIDAATVQLQREHHLTYRDQLNALLKELPHLQTVSVENLVRRIAEVPESVREAVRDAAGGYANHQFFWKMLKPGGNAGVQPTGELAQVIAANFNSVEDMKRRFNEAGAGQIGGGWIFLAVNPINGGLEIMALPNNGSIMNQGMSGLIINDLWDHAYCLKYGSRRKEYLEAWWNLIDWDVIAKRWQGFNQGKTHT